MLSYGRDSERAREFIAARPRDTTRLTLSYLILHRVPPIPLPGLEELEMMCCSLHTVDKLPHTLRTLLVADNPLQHIMSLPPFLEALSAPNTFLRRLPALPPSLQILAVNNTLLEELPPLPPTLRVLRIARSRIKRLPSPLPPALEELEIDGCQIETVPPLPPYILTFSASGSHLREVPDGFDRLLQQGGVVNLNRMPFLPPQKDSESYRAYHLRLWAEQQVAQVARVQERCKAIKADLMAAAWAPQRLERWLEAGMELESL